MDVLGKLFPYILFLKVARLRVPPPPADFRAKQLGFGIVGNPAEAGQKLHVVVLSEVVPYERHPRDRVAKLGYMIRERHLATTTLRIRFLEEKQTGRLRHHRPGLLGIRLRRRCRSPEWIPGITLFQYLRHFRHSRLPLVGIEQKDVFLPSLR